MGDKIPPKNWRWCRDYWDSEESYGQPSGMAAQAALLSGLNPSRTGQQSVPPNNLEPVGLPTDLKLLPGYLASAGYTSHALGRWALGYCSTRSAQCDCVTV